MKLTCILITCVFMELSAASYAQKITLSLSSVPLENVMEQIKKQSGFNFIYDADLMQNAKLVNLNVQNEALDRVLKKCFAGQPVTYLVNDKTIVLKAATVHALPSMVILPKVADITITGTVVDSKGATLPGVTVKLKGTSIGTITDVNGRFSIKAPNTSAVLVISFIGFTTQEYAYKKESNISITLIEESKGLNEVIVVGYGSQKKANVTGALSTISAEKLVQSPVANISNSLVGRAAGIFASQGSGEPGSDASTIRIRGAATFSGSTDPLILIDGIEALTYNNLDPNEIQNITVLKDAASTAVYGIRGANGVIIITTKRGKVGPPQVSYTFQEAVNSFTNVRNTMDSYNYANSVNAAIANDAYRTGSVNVPAYTDADIALYKSGTDPIFHPNINWYKTILKPYSTQQQHNINISGGTKTTQYLVSAGYFLQDGLFRDTRDAVPGFNSNTAYNRYNLRSNFDFNINKRLKIQFDASSQTEITNGVNASTNSVIEEIGRANPLGSPGIVNGKVVNNFAGADNPFVTLLQGGHQNTNRNYLNGTLRIDHQLDFITKGLTIHADVAYQNFNQQKIVNTKGLIIYLPKQVTGATGNSNTLYLPQSDEGVYGFNETSDKYRRITDEVGIDYKRSFGNHDVTGLILYNQNKLYNPNLAFGIPKGYQSLVGRTTYGYKSKYLVEVDLAYNGSEQFAPGKRFGYFPAVSAGWVPTEESFLPKNKIISYLKLRGSYGQVGNDQIGGDRFLYRPTSYTLNTATGVSGASAVPAGYYFGIPGQNSTPYNGYSEGKAGNPDLTWERVNKSDFGMDAKFFDSKLSLTLDYFNYLTKNILANPSTVSAVAGYQVPAYNLGKMSNHGIEADISFNGQLKDFSYNIGGNFSFARNKILFQDEIPRAYTYENRTGQRYGQIFGYVAEGLFNSWAEVNDPNRPVYNISGNKLQPGDIRFKDINGDGIINSDDQLPIGYSTLPEITYGTTFGGQYKGFDFSVLFQGVANVSAPFSSAYGRNFIQGFHDNPSSGAADYLINSWTPERYAAGLPIDFPRFTKSSGSDNYLTSTYFTKDASYVRLKNVELGYTFRTIVLNKIGVKSARIYTNANNLYTWSKLYKGVDPELSATPNVNSFSTSSLQTNQEPYPLVRTLNFGINIKF